MKKSVWMVLALLVFFLAGCGNSKTGTAQGEESGWCMHYFLEDEGKQAEVMQALEDAFGGDVYLHENSWPGLYGILSAMELLAYFMYGIVAVVVLVVISIGFTSAGLRFSFHLTAVNTLLPALIVTGLSAAFSWGVAGRMKRYIVVSRHGRNGGR